jgi:hypothetical protein
MSQEKEYVLDPDGKKANFQFLFKKYPDNSMEFRITKDSGKVYQITAPLYEVTNTNYDSIKKTLPEYPSKIKNTSKLCCYMFPTVQTKFSKNCNCWVEPTFQL